MKGRRLNEAANNFILEHPIASWLIWVLLFFTAISAAVKATPKASPQFGVLAWVTVGAMIYTPVAIALIQYRLARGTPKDLVLMSWVIAEAPLLMSYSALFDRAPQWLVAVALAEAVILMAYSLRRAKRDQRQMKAGISQGELHA